MENFLIICFPCLYLFLRNWIRIFSIWMFLRKEEELLHKKWTENVAKPLQQRIMEKVISYKGLEKTKQENSEYFLKHTNKTV